MADPKDAKLQQSQLKEIEAQLASVEQRMQRLAILKKSIELQLIDPKDSQRFDLFIKQLAKVDVSNIESLRGYISGANDQFDELINNNKQFSKQSESSLKIAIMMDKTFSGVASKIDSATKSTKKLNSSLEETDELVDSFMEGFKEGLEEWKNLDKVQSSIENGMRRLKKSQKDQIKNAFGLNANYDQVSSNILGISKKIENSGTPISNMLQFDIGQIEKLGQSIDEALTDIGKSSFTVNGREVGAELRESVLSGFATGGNELAKNMGERIEVAKKVIQKKSGETSEVVDAMIRDLEAKSIDPDAQILSPEMQGKVEAAWGKIQKKGNAALMDAIVNTSRASIRLKNFNDILDKTAEGSKAVDGIAKKFSLIGRAAETSLDSLQYATRNLMPTWLYQTLGLDDAFQNIGNTAKQGLSDAAKKMAQGASFTEAMSGFAGTFSSGLLKSLGIIGLIVIAVTGLWKMMTAAGESVKELSKEFGVSRNTAHGMYKDILNITAAVGNTSLKQEDVLEVLKKHRDQYGLIMDLNNKANQEAVKFAGELGKQYGIGAGEAYGFTEQLQQLGADKAASQEIAAVAAYASDLAGVPFNNVVKDLAESSEFVATQFAGYPLKAVAAATKIRAMGSSLKQVEKAMEKAFDVKNFLQGMTELNLMTQGVVDLSGMFQKSMSGDAEGVAKEIATQFDKMLASGQKNQFQMRQFAQTVGVSVEELMRGNKIRQKSAELGEDNVELLSKYLDKLNEADVADAKSMQAAAKKLGAAEKLDTIWASIKDTLMQALLPVLEIISDLIGGLSPLLKVIGILFKGIGIVVKGMIAPLKLISDIFSGIGDILSGNMPKFEGITSLFNEWNSLGSIFANIVSMIVGLWTGIKLVNGLKNVSSLISGMNSSTLSMVSSLKNMVSGPLSKVASMTSAAMGPGGALSGMMGTAGSAANNLMGKAGTAASSVMGKASSAVSNIAGKVGGAGNLMKIGGGITAGAVGGISAYKKQKEKGGTDSEAAGAAMIQGGLAASGAVLGTALGGPLGGMIGGFLGDTVGGWLVDNAPGLVKKAGEMWDKLSAKFSKLAETWQPIIEKVFGVISGIIEKAADIWSAIFSKIGDVVSFVIDGLDSFANMLGFDGLAGMFGDVLLYPLNLLMVSLGNLVDMFTMVGQLLSGDFSGAWDTFTGILSSSFNALIPSITKKLGKALINFGKDLITWILSPFTFIGDALKAWVDSLVKWVEESWLGKAYKEAKGMMDDVSNWWNGEESSQNNESNASMLKESVAQTDKLDQLNKASNATVDELSKANELSKAANSTLKGLSEGEKTQLKDAGYSDDIIKKLDEGSVSLEGAMKEQFSKYNLSSDQLKKLADPNTSPKERTAIFTSAPSLAVGTDMVKTDGMAMLHKGEAVVPAQVAKGGFDMSKSNIPIPLPVKMMNTDGIVEPQNAKTGLFADLIKNIAPQFDAMLQAKRGFNVPDNLVPMVGNVSPVKNQIENVSDTAQKNDMYTTQMSAVQQTPQRTSGNQDAILKQLLTAMQDVANRPVQVQIGGVELKSLNSKMKVYNNK